MLVAGVFLDELAACAEASCDPRGPPGQPLPAGLAIGQAARFALVSLGVNILALMLLLAPGINLIAFFGANAYLFSREYFEFAAMRYRPVKEAKPCAAAMHSMSFCAVLRSPAFSPCRCSIC